jgi:hypothetical protein
MVSTPYGPERLGGFRREFRATTRSRLVQAGLQVAVGILLGVTAGMISRTEGYAWWHLALPGVLGLLAVVSGVALLVRAIRNAGDAVLLFEHGFVHRGRRGDEVFAWQEIDCVWQKITRFRRGLSHTMSADNTDREYTVDRHDGRRIVLMEFVDMKELGPAIAGEVARRWFPFTIGEIHDGHEVWLGPVGMSQVGLHYRASVVPWPQASIRFLNGVLVVAHRRWLPAHRIPNLALVLAVAQYMRAGQAAQGG